MQRVSYCAARSQFWLQHAPCCIRISTHRGFLVLFWKSSHTGGVCTKFYNNRNNNKKMKIYRGLLVATLLVVLVGVASQDNNPRAPLHQVLEHARELSRKLDQAKVTSTAEHAHSSNRYVHLSNFKQFLFLIFAATFARV